MSHFYTRRNIIIGLAISLAFVSFFVWYSYRNMKKAVVDTRTVNATLQSLRALEDVMDDMQDIETGQRGYLISGNQQFLQPYDSAVKKLKKDTLAVKALYHLYPERRGLFEHLLQLIRQKTELTQASVSIRNIYGHDSAYQSIQSGQKVMDSIRSIVATVETGDRIVLKESNTGRGTAARTTATLFIVLAVIFITGLIIVFSRISRGIKQREEYERKLADLAGLTAEKDLTASYEAIRKLTGRIQDIREEERTNIAREIHDELGQQLTVLKMDLSWLNKKITEPDDATKKKMEDLLRMLDQIVKSVRRISSELRPSLLDDLGLVAAMEWQLSEFEKGSGIATSMVHTGDDIPLPDTVKTALFRIFQESLTNVAHHSNAKKVTVTITRKENNLFLSISDNGRGFDKYKIADKRTLGILGMQERITMIGGMYEINAETGKGAEVFIQVPLNPHKPTAV